MFRLAALACPLLGLGLIASAAAVAPQKAKQVELRWKFMEGNAFIMDEKIVGKTTLTIQDKKSTEEQIQHRVSIFKCLSKNPLILAQQIKSWKSTITGGLGQDQDDTRLMEKLVSDLVFKVHLSPSGAITRFEGYDQFVARLENLDPAEAKSFKAAFNEEVLRSPLAQVFHVLPPAFASLGQSWNHKYDVPLGPLGNYSLSATFTYRGSKDALEEIDAKVGLSFLTTQSKKGDSSELGIRVLKLDLTQNDGTGRILFDNAAGRLVQMDMNLRIAGTMQLDLKGSQIEVQLDGTDSRTVRISDPTGKF